MVIEAKKPPHVPQDVIATRCSRPTPGAEPDLNSPQPGRRKQLAKEKDSPGQPGQGSHVPAQGTDRAHSSKQQKARAARHALPVLALGELEAFARALLAVLLALVNARVTREETKFLELLAQR